MFSSVSDARPLLPLPAAPQSVNVDASMVLARESINLWWSTIKRATKPGMTEEEKRKAVETQRYHMAGSILLALKYLSIVIQDANIAAAPGSDRKAEYLCLYHVKRAIRQFASHPTVETLLREKTTKSKHPALKLAVMSGRDLYQAMMEGGTLSAPFAANYTPRDLKEAQRIWRIINLYIRLSRTKNTHLEVTKGEVDKKISALQSSIDFLEVLAGRPFPSRVQEDFVKEATPSSNSTGEPEPSQEQVAKSAKAPTKPFETVTVDSSTESDDVGDDATSMMMDDVMKGLYIRKEDGQYLDRYDPSKGVAPRTGPTACPVALMTDSISRLAPGLWIDDQVIEAYLSLVCHQANGHFQPESAPVNLYSTPKWHSWSTYLTSVETNTSHSGWPPENYPQARVDDVKCHVFPVFLQGNHWTMLMITQSNISGGWNVDFYSSMRGYETSATEAFKIIKGVLIRLSENRLKESDFSPMWYPKQPMQTNNDDCGPFVLCVARWIMEDWPLSNLSASHMKTLRQRLIVELESWSLERYT